MNRRTLRERVEDELDEDMARNPASWEYERRNKQRTVDWWFAVELASGARTFHKARYRDAPEVRQAIEDLRAAARRLSVVMGRHYFARVWAWRDQQKETDHE